jgi:transposase
MPYYSEEFKDKIVSKMMAPNAQSVAEVSRESGVSEQSLYNWRNRYRHEGKAVPADPSNPENWSGANKLAVVIESASLNEEQLSEYCRRKGLYAEQIARWKAGAIAGNESSRSLTKAEQQALKKERKKTRYLEKELNRKEKALAETAALLVLKKKAHALWGEPEDERY